jgi:hypothetical protein
MTLSLALNYLTINVPLFKKMRDIIFFLRDNKFLSRFEGQFRGQKSRGPLKMSRERLKKLLSQKKKIMSQIVSHQWCDLFYRLLHSYTRHIERVDRGERDIVLGA